MQPFFPEQQNSHPHEVRSPAAAQTTICLCMIVRNEDPVIRRCLRSVLPFITHWLIVDTGSTDGTQASIRAFMAEHNMPGELVERPWVDFAQNRSEAITLAADRADYLLIIDADEYLEADTGFVMPRLTADVYSFELVSGPFAYPKMQLVRADAGWRYVGVVHEHLSIDHSYTEGFLPGLRNVRIMDGARARNPMTFRRDALLLEEALLEDPGNSRHMFYLAQSYADARETALAIDRYSKRVAMGGWDEEVWCSTYQIAKLREAQGDAWPVVQQALLDAFALRPTRAEPLFRIGAHYQGKREFELAHLFFARAMTIPYPTGELLYVEHEVYRYLLPLEYAVACFYVGRHEEAIRTAHRLLASQGLSPEQRDQVIRNRQYSLDALFPDALSPDAPFPPRLDAATLVAAEGAADPSVLVIVTVDEGSLTTSCLDSLLAQNQPCRAIVLDKSGVQDSALHAALHSFGFTHKRVAADATWADCLQLAADEAKPEDILLPLPAGAVLADKRCIADLVRHFRRYGRALLYGQFRWADGALGDALPLLSPEELAAEELSAAHYGIAFRKELLDGPPLDAVTQPVSLMRRAGFNGIRFCDRPFLLQPR